MKIAPPDTQLSMFDVVPVISCWKSEGAARNAYGYAAQYIVSRLLSLSEIRINGNYEACFDCWKDDVYYEVKSVRSGHKVVIYESRAKKEESAKICLKYIILARSNEVRAWNDIIPAIMAKPVKLIILSSESVHMLARRYTLRKHSSSSRAGEWSVRNGYTRAGYAEGYYNLPVSEIERCTGFVGRLANPFGEGLVELYAEETENIA